MEVVQGKPTDKKIVIAQEIAFAKVLAGNNKTLRDRALKKLQKWLTLRGSGKWEFTEEEFTRIWTGLFYCMWMSDKFLVQEELAESISRLIHCFKKNSNSALLFIKSFNKRMILDWEGLDQYRIDKFNMLCRRFLRQTFVYYKDKNWDESLLFELTSIFYDVVLHRDNALGFVLHFINIYAEELAKVSNGKLETSIVLKLFEPFVKLISRTRDARILAEIKDLFSYLIQQTDTGIEFEEKFNAWKEQGFPGEGPHCMGIEDDTNEEDMTIENGTNGFDDEDEDVNIENQPLDPRAGSVHVYLPQIPVDADAFIKLFKKYQNMKHSDVKGKKLLKFLISKFEALKRGQFPETIKKDPIIVEKAKKKSTVKNAKQLLKFTDELEEAPILTKEFRKMCKELEEIDDDNDDDDDDDDGEDINDEKFEQENESVEEEMDYDAIDEEEIYLKLNMKNKTKNSKSNRNNKNNQKQLKKKKRENLTNKEEETVKPKKIKLSLIENGKSDQNVNQKKNLEKRNKKMKSKKAKQEGKSTQCVIVTPKKKQVKEANNEKPKNVKKEIEGGALVQKVGMKRKILSNWQVQELDTNSPEYYKIETPKIITIEKKLEPPNLLKENEPELATMKNVNLEENPKQEKEKQKKEVVPVFWEKAKAKVNKKSKSKVFVNPFAKSPENADTPNRRISFALDRNMAQENEEYLEEVKNSPRVPFDGSRKPIQSALKSGLAPSPVNPFYRFKKMKL